MEKYITNLYGQSESSTAMLAQNMVAHVAKAEGYRELCVQAYAVELTDSEAEKEKRIEGILSGLSPESMVIAQMPTWNGIAFDEVFLRKIREKTNQLVVFVHDFVPLMFANNAYLFERYLKAYNLADLVILPSARMADRLREQGLSSAVLLQEIWDHVTPLALPQMPRLQRKLKFIGNMSRFPFVKDWKSDLELEVFSQGELEAEGYVTLRGWMYDDQLLRELNKSGFGLVWSENIENQYERAYSEMNVSYKFSTYLSAGLPLIVNKGLAKEEFVTKYGLGLVVEDLAEAIEYVKTISEEEYRFYTSNVKRVAHLLREGYFTKKLLLDIQTHLFL